MPIQNAPNMRYCDNLRPSKRGEGEREKEREEEVRSCVSGGSRRSKSRISPALLFSFLSAMPPFFISILGSSPLFPLNSKLDFNYYSSDKYIFIVTYTTNWMFPLFSFAFSSSFACCTHPCLINRNNCTVNVSPNVSQ